MRYFNFEPSLKLQWYGAQDFDGSQITVNTRGFELWTLSLVDQVIALHVRGLQFKPSWGHFNLWSIKISSTTPPQIRKSLKSQEPTITVGQLSNQWTQSKQGFAEGVLGVGLFTDFFTDFINILISVTWPFQKCGLQYF